MNSILNTVKKLIGLPVDCTDFDEDLIVDINTALSILHQINSELNPTPIHGEEETWDSLIISDPYELVKSYIHLKTQMLFDPPTSSQVSKAKEQAISELEFRIEMADDISLR